MELRRAMFKLHKITCMHFDVDFMQSLTKSRKREYVQSRQLTMTATRELFPKKSLAAIGSALFGKDHATVLHAKKTINNLCDTDRALKSDYDYILKTAKSQLQLKPKKQQIVLTKKEIVHELRKLILKGCDIHTSIEANALLLEL